MRIGARLQAAIEILDDIAQRRRPASEALKDWGAAHRFAGSGDRAAIANLVFDALRRRRSLGWRMGADSPRALVLGVALLEWGRTPDELNAAFAGDPHAPEPLSAAETAAIDAVPLGSAPGGVAGDVPEWLWPAFRESLGDGAAAEGVALAGRAPLDLRVNTLKGDRDRALKALARFKPEPTPISPLGLRIAAPQGTARAPNIQPEPAYARGWVEIQDEGSQLAAILTAADAGMQVADICAGGGGKTLALSAMMANKGQIHAYDSDRHRLKGIFERLKRAGTRNVQVLPAGREDALDALGPGMDIVLADAPCSGSGVWRRRPDAKWRLAPGALEARLGEQDAVLDLAARLVRPGGRIVYATCSVLEAENGARVAAFLARHGEFAPAPLGFMLDAVQAVRDERHGATAFTPVSATDTSVQLTPLRDSTDGFFIAAMQRRG